MTESRRCTLQIIPAQVRIREVWYYTYACQTCKLAVENTPIVIAKKALAMISGSIASPEAIAHIMTQKFVMGSPLYRQEQEMKLMSVHLSLLTMSNWILCAAQDWLMHVYECMHRELVKRQILHADETTLQMLREPEKALMQTAVCGCTKQAMIRTGMLCSMSTRRIERRSIPRSF